MKRIQTLCISLLFIALILISVFMPPTISRIKDKMLFGKVYTQELSESKINYHTKLDVKEKIALIDSYSIGQDNIIMVSQDQKINGQGKIQEITEIASEELKKLKNTGIVSQLSMNNIQYLECVVKSYTNMEDPSINAEIWDVTLSIDKEVVHILMDADTHLILQFNIWRSESMQYLSKGIPEAFASYLGIQWDTIISDKKAGTKQYSFQSGGIVYQYIQINDENCYGIQIASIMNNK